MNIKITKDHIIRILLLVCIFKIYVLSGMVEKNESDIEHERLIRSENDISLGDSIRTFHYEFADSCTWIDIPREHFEKIGLPLSRKSDGRPIQMVHLYACQNFKDYPEVLS